MLTNTMSTGRVEIQWCTEPGGGGAGKDIKSCLDMISMCGIVCQDVQFAHQRRKSV